MDIEVRETSTRGLGLFATRDHTPGDVIRQVAFERIVTEAQPLRSGERVDHCTRIDGVVMLVGYPDRHMNHSCDPNAYYQYDYDAVVRVLARKTIAAGDELSVDYLVNNSGGDSWPCACGSSRCRGETGTSFFELPLRFQREYLPILAPWFVRQHRAQVEALRAARHDS